MTIKSLGNPYDGGKGLTHDTLCECDRCKQVAVPAGLTAQQVVTDSRARHPNHNPTPEHA